MNKIIASLLACSSLFCQYAPTEPAYLLPSKRTALPEYFPSNSDFYCSFDFLYWEGTERGLEYALKNSGASFNQEIQIYEPSFNFNPAFRIGLGTHLPHDNWDLEFAYTRYYNHTWNHASHTNAPSGGILAVWTGSVAFQDRNYQAFWQDADAKWKLHANFFDLFLKHRLYLSRAITLEPAFGLKLALLQQRYAVLYENGNTTANPGRGIAPLQFISSTIAMKNRSFNLGPLASLSTLWKVSNHFDFLGTLSASLLASHFNVGRNESDVMRNINANSLVFDSLRQRDSYWALRPEAGISFGLGWKDIIYRPSSVIQYGFSASYEAQVWWKQNMLFRFIDQTNGAMISPTQGDLFFHGLTIDGFVDF